MDTKKFWEDRLSKEISLQTTGHRAFNAEYNDWLYKAQIDSLDLLLQKNQVQTEGASLFEVGSGGGFFIEYFRGKGVSHVVGLDIAKPSVEFLRQKYPTYQFFHADIATDQMPIQGRFDLVTALNVLFHIVDEVKFHQAICNMRTLAKPGGYLILCDTFEPPLTPNRKHVRNRALSSYQSVFKEQGITILDTIPMYYFLNRVFIPFFGPKVINLLGLGHSFYKMDTTLRVQRKPNFGGIKLLLARNDGA